MTRFPLRLALWEGRNSIRSVGLYMLSISLGVAALVSVHSFRADVARSVAQEAQVLLGADIVMRANRPLPDSVTSILDSLTAAGHETSAAITVPSMVLAPGIEAPHDLHVALNVRITADPAPWDVLYTNLGTYYWVHLPSVTRNY